MQNNENNTREQKQCSQALRTARIEPGSTHLALGKLLNLFMPWFSHLHREVTIMPAIQ